MLKRWTALPVGRSACVMRSMDTVQRGRASLGRGDWKPGSPAFPPPLGEDGAGGEDLGGTQPLPEGVVALHLLRQRQRRRRLLVHHHTRRRRHLVSAHTSRELAREWVWGQACREWVWGEACGRAAPGGRSCP